MNALHADNVSVRHKHNRTSRDF